MNGLVFGTGFLNKMEKAKFDQFMPNRNVPFAGAFSLMRREFAFVILKHRISGSSGFGPTVSGTQLQNFGRAHPVETGDQRKPELNLGTGFCTLVSEARRENPITENSVENLVGVWVALALSVRHGQVDVVGKAMLDPARVIRGC